MTDCCLFGYAPRKEGICIALCCLHGLTVSTCHQHLDQSRGSCCAFFEHVVDAVAETVQAGLEALLW